MLNSTALGTPLTNDARLWRSDTFRCRMVSSPGSQTITPGQLRGHPCKPQKSLQPQGHRQVDLTFRRAVCRHGAAVLPAVARVDDHGLSVAPLPHRPSGREGPSGSCQKNSGKSDHADRQPCIQQRSFPNQQDHAHHHGPAYAPQLIQYVIMATFCRESKFPTCLFRIG